MLNSYIARQPLGIIIAILLASCAAPARAQWPDFRGPGGMGHSDATSVPLNWSETENIAWKAPVAGRGWSTPVVEGNQVWLTTALDDGRSLRALCLDFETGRQLHDIEVFTPSEPQAVHSKNSHASPTPLLEGGRVYVHFGTNGTACLSSAGEILWKNTELVYQHGHGPGGSPVLYKDLLLMSCDGTDVQFVVALEKSTGQIRWKTPREGRMAYSTPLVINAAGRDQLISTGGDRVVSYDPATGEEIWSCRYDGYSLVPRPVFAHALVFISSGYDNPVLYAIRVDGTGDVTNTHVAWQTSRGAPHNPSPLVIGDELYVVSDRGVATCFEARTGTTHWTKRLGGNYSASPIFAAGRIYLLDEEGKTTVIAPGKTYQELAVNQVEGQTLASLAISGRSLLLRAATHLYRIEEPSGAQE